MVSDANEPYLLDDGQMSRFVNDGYIVLEPDELPATLHQRLYDATLDLYDEARRVGDGRLRLQYYADN